jgi:Ca-activated chloride channel family protein
MTFARPIYLYALILVPLLLLFWLWTERRRQTALARLGQAPLMARLSAVVNRRGRHWQAVLWFLALVLLLVGLARPQWGTQMERVTQEGVQVMVVLDVSQSMLVEDIKPTRLSRAKLEIADLMDQLGGDEVGLVLFSGASFIQFPLTSDYATARSFLDAAEPGVISRPGTAIGDAIHTAMTGFDPHRSSQRVILLITDGEDHEGDALKAAQQAAEEGVIIYAIGFGSPQGDPIPVYNDAGEVTGFKKDANGEVVLSKLDESTLQQIAQAGGGQYYRASADGSELKALQAEISRLQKEELAERFETYGVERFQGFVLAGLAALVIAGVIPDRKREANYGV